MDSPIEDKEWASKYLLDPLTAPEPSQETGPGSRLIASAPGSRASSGSRVPASVRHSTRDSKGPVGTSYPTPPSSASPSQSSFHPSNPFASTSYRQAVFAGYSSAAPGRKSTEERTVDTGKGRRRGSSLGERFPGDMSHRPLDQLRKEAKLAHRAPHLRKKHLPGADLIDSLDRSMGTAYHHEGPYDATLISRNAIKNPPVEAVRESNIEALKATPRENIRDALDKHVPLQGTAIIPPGMLGYDGKPMEYEEGADLMREEDAPGGAYKRYKGMQYHPEDYKGKGEPSFTIERALKQDAEKSHRRIMSDGSQGYEMQPTSRQLRSESPADFNSRASGSIQRPPPENEGGVHRSNTTGRQVGERIRRRLGSFRKSLRSSEA